MSSTLNSEISQERQLLYNRLLKLNSIKHSLR